MAEELVRLNDPFIRWLAGCPSNSFTHQKFTPGLLCIGYHAGQQRQREGSSNLKVPSLQQARQTWCNRARLREQRWVRPGNSAGRKDPSSGRNSVRRSSFRYAVGAGGPKGTEYKSKACDSSLMDGEAGRRPRWSAGQSPGQNRACF